MPPPPTTLLSSALDPQQHPGVPVTEALPESHPFVVREIFKLSQEDLIKEICQLLSLQDPTEGLALLGALHEHEPPGPASEAGAAGSPPGSAEPWPYSEAPPCTLGPAVLQDFPGLRYTRRTMQSVVRFMDGVTSRQAQLMTAYLARTVRACRWVSEGELSLFLVPLIEANLRVAPELTKRGLDQSLEAVVSQDGLSPADAAYLRMVLDDIVSHAGQRPEDADDMPYKVEDLVHSQYIPAAPAAPPSPDG